MTLSAVSVQRRAVSASMFKDRAAESAFANKVGDGFRFAGTRTFD